MQVKNTAILHEKVGENDHYYYVASGAVLEEVEFVLKRYLSYVHAKQMEAQEAVKNQPVPPVEEPKPEEVKVEA